MKIERKRMRIVSLIVVGVVLLASPNLLQNIPGKHYSQTDTQLVFFGTSQTSVLTANSVLLAVNLTNVEPTPVNAVVQAVVRNAINNQSIEIENSSTTSLLPSAPTIVNTTIPDLMLCTNYSLSVEVTTPADAVLAPIRTIFTFPCEIYSHALNLGVNLNVLQDCLGPCVNTTLTNTLDEPVDAIVVAIYHSQAGQTVCACFSSITLNAGATKSAYVTGIGTTGGLYNVTVFAWDTNGVPLSGKENIQVNYTA
jgi:hypothetical protein